MNNESLAERFAGRKSISVAEIEAWINDVIDARFAALSRHGGVLYRPDPERDDQESDVTEPAKPVSLDD